MTSVHFAENINVHSRVTDDFETLKKKNNELYNDMIILKKLVYMLNVELELRESASRNTITSASSDLKFKEDYLTSTDIRNIEPLLRAFEETKKEKDELLTNYKQTFDEFSVRCKEIASENSFLRQQLQESKEKAESSLMEWKKLHEKFILTEEHNQLLTRQVKLLQNKFQNEEMMFQEQIKQCEDEKKELNEKLESSKAELCLLKGKVSVLSEIRNGFPAEIRPVQDNFSSSILMEMKKLSSDLKLIYAKETQTLKTRLKTLESLKCDLELKLATVTSERDHLLGYTSAMKSETRQINIRLKTMENELQIAKKNENDSRHQLLKSMTFIRELVSNQNSKMLSKKSFANANSNSYHSD